MCTNMSMAAAAKLSQDCFDVTGYSMRKETSPKPNRLPMSPPPSVHVPAAATVDLTAALNDSGSDYLMELGEAPALPGLEMVIVY